jgi:hypothetical protein
LGLGYHGWSKKWKAEKTRNIQVTLKADQLDKQLRKEKTIK